MKAKEIFIQVMYITNIPKVPSFFKFCSKIMQKFDTFRKLQIYFHDIMFARIVSAYVIDFCKNCYYLKDLFIYLLCEICFRKKNVLIFLLTMKVTTFAMLRLVTLGQIQYKNFFFQLCPNICISKFYG